MRSILNIESRPWTDKLSALASVIDIVGGVWVDKSVLHATHTKVLNSFERDLADLREPAGFIFSTRTESESLTEQNVELLRRWQLMGDGPTLAALAALAFEHFQIEKRDELMKAILIAGVLGEIPNDLSYHNNMHYRKVLLQTIRMIAVHNGIYAGTSRAFTGEQIALLLIAACVHDLGHDGKGNTVRGVFEQGRLERRSFDLAAVYLKAVGFKDSKTLEDLRIVILCTEVTPLGDPGNTMSQMKAAYRYHFLGYKTKTHTLGLDIDLAPLQKDPQLTMMSLILHEADIATSAGLTYPVTKYETTIYMQEIK